MILLLIDKEIKICDIFSKQVCQKTRKSHLVYYSAKQSPYSVMCYKVSAIHFLAHFLASEQWNGHCRWPFARYRVSYPHDEASSDIFVKLNAVDWN